MDLKDKQKIVKIIGSAEDALTHLETTIKSLRAQGKSPAKLDAQLLKSIHRALDLLKTKPFVGENIPQKYWPKEFFNLPNLFRMELSQFWRLLYYVTGDEVTIVSVVFEISDHKQYDNIFGYHKK